MVVPSHVRNVVMPSTQIASRTAEFQAKDYPRSRNAEPLRLDALGGLSWIEIPSPLAFAATLLAGAIGQITPDGSQVPVLPAAAVNMNDTTELLNVSPKLGVEPVEFELLFVSRCSRGGDSREISLKLDLEEKLGVLLSQSGYRCN